jgi:hypothetical protein
VQWHDLAVTARVSRYEAVRSRMGQAVVARATILEHLALAGGGVDEAVDSLTRAHARAVAGLPGTAAERDLPAAINGLTISYFETADQERRAAADMLPLLANGGRDPANRIDLSRGEAALVLEVADGDLQAAVALIDNLAGTMELLHERYDKLRSLSGTPAEQQEQRDAMLAHLVHMTDRADWWSVLVHLNLHQWNFVTAVAVWLEIGIIPVHHPKDKAGRATEGTGRRQIRTSTGLQIRPMPTLAECTQYKPNRSIKWKPEPAQFTTTPNSNAPEPNIIRQSKEERKNRPFSFVINHNRQGVKIGCPDRTKLDIEYFAAERYKMGNFRGNNYRWPEFPSLADTHKPLFDFNRKEHVDNLNSWRRMNYSRITGMLLREAGAAWSQEEMDHLYTLYAKHYATLKAAHTSQDPLKFRVSEATSTAWAAQHEKKFGTGRTANAMLLMATRTPKFSNDFGLLYNDDNVLLSQARRLRPIATAAGINLTNYELRSANRDVAFPADIPGSGDITRAELRSYIDAELINITAGDQTGFPWRCFLRTLEAFYRSAQGVGEIAEMQRILQVMQIPNLDLATIAEQDVIWIVQAVETRQEKANPTPGTQGDGED